MDLFRRYMPISYTCTIFMLLKYEWYKCCSYKGLHKYNLIMNINERKELITFISFLFVFWASNKR